MPVVGANKIKARMKSFVSDVSDKKAMQFANAVGSSAAILSKEKAPLEYGTLHNSQRLDVIKVAGNVRMSLSYNTKYAAALNNPSANINNKLYKTSGVLASSKNKQVNKYNMDASPRTAGFSMVSGTGWSPKTLIEKSSSTLSGMGGATGSWNPRPPVLKDGPAWNPNATPRFLEYGFESKEGQANLAKYLEIFKI